MMTAECLRDLMDYAPDTGVFVWKKTMGGKAHAGDVAGCLTDQGYVRIGVGRRRHKAHRLAWLWFYGVWPEGEVDHVNNDRADNRISNLRLATSSQNKCNSILSSANASGFKGVSLFRQTNRWQAYIKIGGERRHLGYFSAPELAAAAYDKAAVEHFGEFALINGVRP